MIQFNLHNVIMYNTRGSISIKFGIIISSLLLASCGLLDSDPNHDLNDDNGKPGLPDNSVLLATTDGRGSGIWTFDPGTLEVQDTLLNRFIWSINYASDYRTLYTAWRDRNSNIRKAYAIDVETREIVRKQEIWSPIVKLDRTGTRLISMGIGIQMLDAHTFEILHEGHTDIFNPTAKIAASPVKDEFYALINEDLRSGLSGLMIFDAQTFSVKSIIPLTDDENRRRGMQGSYIDVSPDGRYVYATASNWESYGSFHVIDLQKEEQIFEAQCGGFSWLGVSPDGRYVYISDPAGAPFTLVGLSYEFVPTNQILRYDVERRDMEVFVDGAEELGLSGPNLITSSIAVAPDSRSMFIRILSAGETDEGISPSIIHVDTRTRELLNVYRLTPDPDGFVRSYLHQLKIGFKPD
jgi:hypothetical protein